MKMKKRIKIKQKYGENKESKETFVGWLNF